MNSKCIICGKDFVSKHHAKCCSYTCAYSGYNSMKMEEIELRCVREITSPSHINIFFAYGETLIVRIDKMGYYKPIYSIYKNQFPGNATDEQKYHDMKMNFLSELLELKSFEFEKYFVESHIWKAMERDRQIDEIFKDD